MKTPKMQPFPTSCSRCVTLAANPEISNERGKNRVVMTTNKTYF